MSYPKYEEYVMGSYVGSLYGVIENGHFRGYTYWADSVELEVLYMGEDCYLVLDDIENQRFIRLAQ